jgi:hypothetical protein
MPMRTLLATGLLALLLAAPADARRLKPAGKLKATAVPGAVKLSWKDRARGETRWVVRRAGRKARLRRNRTAWTDRRVQPGVTYRYTVRPCRRKRCAKRRTVRVTAIGTEAPGGNDPPPPGAPPPAGTSPMIGGCAVFPADNPWNTDVSRAPVLHDYTDTFPAAMTLWPDFGGAGAYGIPFVSVPADQPLVPIGFEVADESDPGPYPIPLDAPVEGGGDRHVLALRQGDCRLFELYAAERAGAGWNAYSGAVFDLRSNALRPDGWTSADAAGLPILPGLARRDEADAGAIRHALRITVPRTSDGYIHPATHAAASGGPADPPMGLRLRLKGDYDISFLQGQARAVAQALKTYGALVADNSGGNPNRIYISGATDLGWDDDALNGLKQVPASALEAVQTGPVIPAH